MPRWVANKVVRFKLVANLYCVYDNNPFPPSLFPLPPPFFLFIFFFFSSLSTIEKYLFFDRNSVLLLIAANYTSFYLISCHKDGETRARNKKNSLEKNRSIFLLAHVFASRVTSLLLLFFSFFCFESCIIFFFFFLTYSLTYVLLFMYSLSLYNWISSF